MARSRKTWQLGLGSRKARWTAEEKVLLREMFERGVPHDEQVERLGKSTTSVVRMRQRLGLVMHRHQPRHDEAAHLSSLLEDVELMLRAKLAHHEILEAIHEGRALAHGRRRR